MNSENPTANPINILLVDDNPDNLRLLSNMLTEHGYQTRRVISGRMALQAAKATNFDLILLDINLPQMDGYEVCRQLKADSQTANIPVIFISAFNEVLDKVKAFSVGGADYISKPFQLEEVLARVENQVKIFNLQQQLQKLNANLEQKVSERTKELQIANQKLKQYQQKLLNRSLKDSVTNLDNKISFMGQLRQAVKQIQIQPDYGFALLVFDCYCPQSKNEAFDLKVEDSIALTMADRLSNSATSSRVIARLGDNEFVIIIDGVRTLERATEIAEKIQAKLTLPLDFNAQKLEIEVHYGIGLGIKDSEQSEQILKNARTLARQAKNESYCNLQRFQQEIDLNESTPRWDLLSSRDHPSRSNYFNIVTEFESAFKRQELTLLYQPIISLDTGEIKELEVVSAWSERPGKIISSSELARAIQQKGPLSLSVLKWMFQAADSDFKKWQEIILWHEDLSHIDENIAIRFKLLDPQLWRPNLIQELEQITANLEIDRTSIILEIPEAFVQENTILASQISQQLNQLGFYLSIDNLSPWYLALNSQYNFLFNNLKLASSLTTKIDESPQKKAIIKKTLGLAHELNMTVTATNIETSQQLKSWQQLGCEFGTGNFFSKPVAPQEIENLIINNPWLM